MKILILRFGALGDIVHTTIIAQAIKKSIPDCEIHYCAEKRYIDAIKYHPDIDFVHSYDQTQRKDWRYTVGFAHKLKKENYDLIFNLTNALRNHIISCIAHPKKIILYKKYKNLHVIESFFLSARKTFPELKLPEKLNLGISSKDMDYVRSLTSEIPHPYLIISPGGETDGNRQGRIWSKEKWIELANKLRKKYNANIFINGSQAEMEYHTDLAKKIDNAFVFSGKLTIAQSMCLYKLADLFISGDSGPLHIASGLDINTIGLFGSTDPLNVAPYGKKGYIVQAKNDCKFCWQKKCTKLNKYDSITPCMNSIEVQDILNIIEMNNLLTNA